MTQEPAPTTLPAGQFAALRSPTAWAILVLVFAIGLTADLVTKSVAWSHFVDDAVRVDGRIRLMRTPADDITVVEHVLRLTAVPNEGAAMGLGQGRRLPFMVVSLVASGVLLYFFATSGRRKWHQVLLGLLLAGVIGNFYDRLVHEYVRDMIYAFPGVEWSDLIGSLPSKEVFPWVFNLADVYLCVGVTIVIAWSILFGGRDEAETPVVETGTVRE